MLNQFQDQFENSADVKSVSKISFKILLMLNQFKDQFANSADDLRRDLRRAGTGIPF